MEADRASERATRIVRRLITVPAFIAAFVVGATLLPVIVPFAAGTDMIRGSRFAVTRAVLFSVYYFGCETAGILASSHLRFGTRTGSTRISHSSAGGRPPCSQVHDTYSACTSRSTETTSFRPGADRFSCCFGT
jgi:hypothetical protein